jgi:hypothetical protein
VHCITQTLTLHATLYVCFLCVYCNNSDCVCHILAVSADTVFAWCDSRAFTNMEQFHTMHRVCPICTTAESRVPLLRVHDCNSCRQTSTGQCTTGEPPCKQFLVLTAYASCNVCTIVTLCTAVVLMQYITNSSYCNFVSVAVLAAAATCATAHSNKS